MIFVIEIDHLFGLKGSGVISDNFLGAAKSRKDIALKELDNDGIIGLSAGNGFDPLSKVISGRKDPLVLA